MMLVGYMRVSKADGSQTTHLQRDALASAGVGSVRIYEDMTSGKRDDRRGLTACLKALRRGDTLLVWKLDRLGRNLRHLVNTVHELTIRGIGFKVLTGHGATIDATTPSGKMVFGFSMKIFSTAHRLRASKFRQVAGNLAGHGAF
jgi:DNA invertase Pin-like site-specific DNA recombinase